MRLFLTLVIVLCSSAAHADGALYTPDVAPLNMISSQDVTLPYPNRARGLDVRVTFPAGAKKIPLLVWSHGLFGSQETYQPLVSIWAAYGYVVIQPTHADSLRYGRAKLSSTSNWDERPQEISYILDHLADIEQKIPALTGVIDHETIAVGGHSFGAHTTQLVAGMTTKRLFNFSNQKYKSHADVRPQAFIALSPQGQGRIIDQKSYATVTRPILYVTGSNDESPVTGDPYTWRMDAFNFSGSKNKFLLFIKDAYHGFGGIAGKARYKGAGPENANHVAAVSSTTLAFLDAYLKNDKIAKNYLMGDDLAKASGGQASIIRK